MIRTYSELITIPSFIERYRYLKLGDKVGEETFGFDRYLNQLFYRSKEWKQIRDYVIIRDNGCDLGSPDREIPNGIKLIVHHMNPMSIDDVRFARDEILNPEYLITTMKITHDAIHYGDESLLMLDPIDRSPNDTCPWRVTNG